MSAEQGQDQEQPFLSHLEELRKRLMIAAISWLVAFLGCYAFAERFFDFIATPVRQALPEGQKLVFITATEPFFTFLKVAALAGFLVSLPVILWQIWKFVAPGLYAHEKRFAVPFVASSFLCFLAGTYFGFFYVFPTIFTFLIKYGTGSGDIEAMLSMGAYLSISIKLLLAFGMVFELPIICFFLGRMGVIDYQWLGRNRKYALLCAFVIGAILTPPDLFSQTALAIPFIVLYELSVWLVRFTGKKRVEDELEDEDAADDKDGAKP